MRMWNQRIKLVGILLGLIPFVVSCGKNMLDSATFQSVADIQVPGVEMNLSNQNGVSNSSSMTFSFTSSAQDLAHFECQLNKAAVAKCESPFEAVNLAEGDNSFTVWAVDKSGNRSLPQNLKWKIDKTLPLLSVAVMPSALTKEKDLRFEFSAMDALSGFARFECQIDGGAAEICTSPKSYTNLNDGSYTINLVAYDVANNKSLPFTQKVIVDTLIPVVTLQNMPVKNSNQRVAQFNFQASDLNGILRTECSLDTQVFQNCASSISYNNLTDGDHVFRVKAIDNAGNESLVSYDWVVDTLPPMVNIDLNPRNPSNSPTASFAFSAPQMTASSFECRLDSPDFTTCASPKEYTALTEGSHTFRVRARDAAGNISPESLFVWIVDTRPPVINLSSFPRNPTNSVSASFAFNAVGGDAVQFQCGLDQGALANCSSPINYTNLSTNAAHVFRVTARDAAGNTSQAFQYNWTIDTAAPIVAFTQTPSATTTATNASFSFVANETSGFECRLDNAAFASCTSSRAFTNLTVGSHTFSVRATDSAGNISDIISFRWTIEAITNNMATLTWDNNSETDLAGYIVYYGTSPGNYSQSINVGRLTPTNGQVEYQLSGLNSATTYYFAVKAYNTSEVQSDFSMEVSKAF